MGISAIGISEDVKDALFVLGVVCAMIIGGLAGAYCTWGFILMYSIVLGIVFLGNLIVLQSNSTRFLYSFIGAAIPLFLICSWCSFWVSISGVLRK